MVAIEAIACGRPVVTRVSSEFSEYKEFPLLDISTPEEIGDAILSFKDRSLWKKEYEFFEYHHNPRQVVRRIIEIYRELNEGNK